MIIPRVVTNLLPNPIVLNDVISFDDTPITLLPGVQVDLFVLAADEDLAKSYHLKHLQAVNAISVANTFTTVDTQADLTGLLVSWALLNDVYVQFSPVNGTTSNAYVSSVNTPFTAPLVVTDGDGTQDLLNSVSTIVVTIDSGPTGATINGQTDPVTLTFVQGMASIDINSPLAGAVSLVVLSPTHPSVTLDVTDTATVTFS